MKSKLGTIVLKSNKRMLNKYYKFNKSNTVRLKLKML